MVISMADYSTAWQTVRQALPRVVNGDDFVTQSAHINFLHNVRSGTIYACAEPVKRGGHMAVFHVSITDPGNTLLADGVVDMYRINKRNPE